MCDNVEQKLIYDGGSFIGLSILSLINLISFIYDVWHKRVNPTQKLSVGYGIQRVHTSWKKQQHQFSRPKKQSTRTLN